jgi:hypothetical protein
MHPTRQRLVTGTAKLEALRQRNDAQRRRLVKALNAMADHATGAVAKDRKAAEAGDPEAIRRARRASYGRTIARRTVADLQAARGDEEPTG